MKTKSIMDSISVENAVEKVDCPHCDVDAGSKCVTYRGEEYSSYIHTQRWDELYEYLDSQPYTRDEVKEILSIVYDNIQRIEDRLDQLEGASPHGDKFELTDDCITYHGEQLHRIRALRTFRTQDGVVQRNDLGGYVEDKSNLSQKDGCWIADDAVVCKEAVVKNDALVRDNAVVANNVEVRDKALVYGYARVILKSQIYGDARIGGYTSIRFSSVSGKTHITGRSHIEHSNITDNSCISGNAVVMNSTLEGGVHIDGNPYLCYANLKGDIEIGHMVRILDSTIHDDRRIIGLVEIDDEEYT